MNVAFNTEDDEKNEDSGVESGNNSDNTGDDMQTKVKSIISAHNSRVW